MFNGFDVLMKHMLEEHPNSSWFGDSVVSDGEKVIQKCQICGGEINEAPKNI